MLNVPKHCLKYAVLK